MPTGSTPLPPIKVQIGFASNPLDVPQTWTDISDLVRHIKIDRGRQHVLSRFEPGRLTLTCNGRGRELDPFNTSSTYAPNVKVNKQIQVLVEWASTWYPLFTGFVDAYEPLWLDNLNTDIQITATDGLRILQAQIIQGLTPSGSAAAPIGGTAGSGGPPPVKTPSAYNPTPGTPTITTVTTGIDNIAQTNNAYAIVSWTANPFLDGVTLYMVRWRKGTDTVYSQAGASNNLTCKVASLIPGIAYDFGVQAYNGLTGIWSGWSADVAQTTAVDTTPPPVPTGLTVLLSLKGAFVSWAGASSTDIKGFLLQVKLGSAAYVAAYPDSTLGTSFNYIAPSGTAAGTTIAFQVASIDWTGNQSAWSTAVSTTLVLIATADISASAVTAALLAAGAVTSAALAASAVTSAAIAAGAVGATQIANAAVGTAKIANAAITNALIANAAIATANIQSAAITTALIGTAAITNALIADCSISKLTAGWLDVYGLLTAGGGFRTGTSGARMNIDNTGFQLYDNSGVDHGFGTDVSMEADSSTGALKVSGAISASTIQGVAGGASGGGARMWMDFTAPSAGTAPTLEVHDGTAGRVQLGNLLANGQSPAMYGMRACDAGGTPIFDSLGLSQSAKFLAVNSGGFIAFPLSSLSALGATFTSYSVVDRPQNILIIGLCYFVGGSTAGSDVGGQAQVGCYERGAFAPPQFARFLHTGTVGNYGIKSALTSISYQGSTPVGSYNACIAGAWVGSNISFGIDGWQVFVIQFGG